MAANNYFGFTHGGTQYAATGTPAYQAPQPGYAVAPAAAAAAAATYTTQRAATGYETYQPPTHTAPGTYAVAAGTTAPATYDYGYARTAPAAYDTTKTYYQQAAPATQAYSTADYQGWQTTPPPTGKAAYSATYTTQSVRPAAQQHKAAPQYNAAAYTAPVQQAPVQTTNYTYTTPVTQQPPKVTSGPSYNGAAAAVSYGTGATTTNYSTAYTAQNPTNVVQATPAPKPKTAVYSATMYVNPGKQNNTWQGYKKPGVRQMRPKIQPKPQQLHYCEVCKISCAGPQTYREHLEGQRHKKKEALQKEGTTPQAGARGGQLRCELCDVVCTGSDAYAAHLRGAKHQKVVKLHTRLGKPIPEVDMKTAKAAAAATLANMSTAPNTATTPPKINFVQSGTLGTVVGSETKDEAKTESADVEMATENEVTPVGQEYIEEIKNDDGKLISFNCKLCECKFNDPNAKDMHMKGRRHRLQFKKKVNPDLVVDVKPSGRRGRMHEEKRRRDDFMRRREEDRSFWTDDRMYWEERRRYEEEFEYMEWMRRRGPGPTPFLQPPPFGIRRPDTLDDRHIIAKHQSIYPKEAKLQCVHKIVSHCEKALKLVSDQIAERAIKEGKQDSGTANSIPQPLIKKEIPPLKKEGPEVNDSKDGIVSKAPPVIDDKDSARVIKGVMRVGILAKGLMLADENCVSLVVLCGEIPTKPLLNEVFALMCSQMKVAAPEENYNISLEISNAGIVVSSTTEPNIVVNITLTSPVLREMLMQASDGEGATVRLANQETLDQAKCLEALAQLRRAKWFQARPANNHSSVMVIRILRDLCHRNPTWAPLSQWGIELLVDKVVGCVGFTVAEAMRKVLEAIAGGILLPGSCGISDPCEREPTDATGHLSIQQRADITASAQHALRLVAFRQIHKVLGMAALPPPRHPGNRHGMQRFNRKRRRDHSAGETNDSEAGDGKKDKKEGESDVSMDTAGK
uniref:Putative transcription factor nfat subunit nf90 n=1 Tax=Panstrongylus megistus TaxID=65343 RepID=A0A069DXW5_9HEMI